MVAVIIKNKLHAQDKYQLTGLEDVEQDGEAIWLSETEYGACSYGHCNCYAIIISNQKDMAIIHASSLPEDLILDVLEDERMRCSNSPIQIVLARCFSSYNEDYENEKKSYERRGLTFERLDTKSYFAEQDLQYENFFKKLNISHAPNFITMRHDFLVLGKNRELSLFNELSPEKYQIRIKDESMRNEKDFFNSVF